MVYIAESDLIINQRGAIYHLDLRPEELASDIITVGDPDRVKQVSRHFDHIEFKRRNREFITHTGYIGKKRFSVVSTGIGAGSIDIVMNELDALINIDFQSRREKPELKKLKIVRIGTSGSLQKDIPLESFVASTHGLGIDNLLNFYKMEPQTDEKELLDAFSAQTGLSNLTSKPYLSSCSQALISLFNKGFYKGITVTCPGFYGPQNRVMRLTPANPAFIDQLSGFNFKGHRISNFEMETAGIFALGRLLNHEVLSLNAILANRINGEFARNPSRVVKKLIIKSLDILSAI